MSDRVLCRLCKYSRCHGMTKHPAYLSLVKSSAIGQLCIGDDILVLGEALCNFEVIKRMDAYRFNTFVLGTTRSLASQACEASKFDRKDTQDIVLVFPPDQA